MVYASKSLSPYAGGIRRAERIRARLGSSTSVHDPFPPKPRYMHRRVYERLKREAETEHFLALLQLVRKPLDYGERKRETAGG